MMYKKLIGMITIDLFALHLNYLTMFQISLVNKINNYLVGHI